MVFHHRIVPLLYMEEDDQMSMYAKKQHPDALQNVCIYMIQMVKYIPENAPKSSQFRQLDLIFCHISCPDALHFASRLMYYI